MQRQQGQLLALGPFRFLLSLISARWRSRTIAQSVVSVITAAALFFSLAGAALAEEGAGHGDPPPAEVTSVAVKLRDRKVFELYRSRAGVTAESRAQSATRVLEAAADEPEEPDVHVETQGDVAVLYVSKTPVVQLDADDAVAAGDASLTVHAASVAARVRDALQTERRRHAAAQSVFSVSLVVFAGLIAFLLLRKIGELSGRARDWVSSNPEQAPNLRVQGIDVISPRALTGGLMVALSAGKVLVQLGVVYAWLVVSFSLFEATRSYTTKLTQALVTPLSGLAQRLVGSVPVLIVSAITLFALLILLRFAGVFFQSVAQGTTTVSWLPQDKAHAIGVLVRGGLILGVLVLGMPLVVGSTDGVLSRAGALALGALALAATPLLATGIMGVLVVFGRKLKPGDVVDVAGRSGRVTRIDLLETHLQNAEGAEVRVPHLLSLMHTTTVSARTPLVQVELSVAPQANHTEVRKLMIEAASPFGRDAHVELRSFGADAARYVVTVRSARHDVRGELLLALAEALLSAKVPLGPSEART